MISPSTDRLNAKIRLSIPFAKEKNQKKAILKGFYLFFDRQIESENEVVHPLREKKNQKKAILKEFYLLFHRQIKKNI